MAGRGSRFAKEGYLAPKPLISVGGRPMIKWVLDNVDSPLVDATFIFLVLREHEERYGISASLAAVKPGARFVYVEAVTEGAACTALLARELIADDTPLLIANSDQFVEWDVDAFWAQCVAERETHAGNVLCFHVPMELNDVKWSYAQVSAAGDITDIQEKVVISPHATVGVYYWRRGSEFVRHADEMVARGLKSNGEYYVAPVYNLAVAEGARFSLSFCDKMWGLGVPADLTAFLTDYLRPRLIGSAGAWTNPLALTESGEAEPLQLPLPFPRGTGPQRFISHRGNLTGPNPGQENRPEYILAALAAGFDCEIDARLDEASGEWRLGHDSGLYPIPYSFLLHPRLWVHCKNGAALRALCADRRVHCYWHDGDDYTLTSRGIMWVYPNKPVLGPRSVAVMFSNPEQLLDTEIFGVCSDHVALLRRGQVERLGRPRRVQLVIFDLDGVLVDSRELHYEALNRAIAEVAGAQYVITRHEHESFYDGLSTNQKLRHMTLAKDLAIEHHKPIWVRKQELTEELVRERLRPLPHVTRLVRTLKAAGYPVAVASNCIKSSVASILETIGLLPLVDAFFSNEDVARAKPAPDIYRRACAAFCVPPERALVVEDTVKGFEAAILAGCNLLRVETPEDTRVEHVLRRMQELDVEPPPVTVVVPLAGSSAQSWLGGPDSLPAEVPIFLADAHGCSVLEAAMRSIFSERFPMRFIFVVKEEQCSGFQLEALCCKAARYQPTTVLRVRGDTLGALVSALEARPLLDTDAPLLLFDGSHALSWGEGGSVDELLCGRFDGGMTTHTSSDPRWSYVRTSFRSAAAAPVLVTEVHEKVSVSSTAATGLYFWRRSGDFVAAADEIVASNARTRGWFFLAPAFNLAISKGAKIEAVPVHQSWSLRSASEVASFVANAFSAAANDAIEATYAEMRGRHERDVAANGFEGDARLAEAVDPRRCLALYALCSPSNFRASPLLERVAGKLRAALSARHIVYGVEDLQAQRYGKLHFTLMQLVGFDMFPKVSLPADYGALTEASLLRHLHAFKVNFSQLIVTRKSVLIAGHPTVDVNWSRDQLRRTLTRSGYPLFEPYKNDIAHMTLVRFQSEVTPEEAAAVAAAAAEALGALGTLTVSELALSAASWRMTQHELPADARRIVLLQS